MKKISPYWALLVGALSIPAEVIDTYWRLGLMPNFAAPSDYEFYLFFFISGSLGGWILIYFLNLQPTASLRWLMLVAFLLASPVAILWMLGGALLGPLGVLFFPQIAWLIAIRLADWVGSLVSRA